MLTLSVSGAILSLKVKVIDMLIGLAHRRACEAFAIALASSLNSEADNLVNSTRDMFNAEEILAQVDYVIECLQEVITKAHAEYFRLRTGEVEE